MLDYQIYDISEAELILYALEYHEKDGSILLSGSTEDDEDVETTENWWRCHINSESLNMIREEFFSTRTTCQITDKDGRKWMVSFKKDVICLSINSDEIKGTLEVGADDLDPAQY